MKTQLKILFGFYFAAWCVLVITLCLQTLNVRNWDFHVAWLLLISIPLYALLYLLPCGILAAVSFIPKLCRSWLPKIIAQFGFFIIHLFLIADLGLFRNFGFHFNGLVWNLLTTPGGIESMGLRGNTIVALIIAALCIGIFDLIVLPYLARQDFWLKIASYMYKKTWRWVFLSTAVCFCIGMLMGYGYFHFKGFSKPLLAVEVIPGFIPITMRDFLISLGVKAPERHEINMRSISGVRLNYPEKPIIRDKNSRRYNLLWLACESWRWDMLEPNIMPRASEFASRAVNFRHHFSGGNGTRTGVFSMFYGLYGNYWNFFLKSNRGPVLLDWMREDDYKFFCLTSAKFSYPEFDKTVFSQLNAKELHEYSSGKTYERDRYNLIKLTDFLKTHNDKQPFMAFMFFESPHAPYEFPVESIIRKDYSKELNYLKVGNADGTLIKNRYINAVNHLDQCLGELFDTMSEHKLWDNTIVVLVGDHGEEFYEKGRLGHNSTFVNEQVRTPCVLYIPGKKPAVYSKMSSHLDIPAMLAPFFGVKNPSRDFSSGKNLLDFTVTRNYAVAASWDELFFIGEKYKTLLPTNAISSVKRRLTDIDDNPVEQDDEFFAETKDYLFEIQKEIRRFAR